MKASENAEGMSIKVMSAPMSVAVRPCVSRSAVAGKHLLAVGDLAVGGNEVGAVPAPAGAVADFLCGEQHFAGPCDPEPVNGQVFGFAAHGFTGDGEDFFPMPRRLLREGAVDGRVAVSGDHLRELGTHGVAVVVDEEDDFGIVGSCRCGQSDEGGSCHRCRFLGGGAALCGSRLVHARDVAVRVYEVVDVASPAGVVVVFVRLGAASADVADAVAVESHGYSSVLWE